jgi:hypothetical protein
MNLIDHEQSGTGMSLEEMKAFIRNHFEEFVNARTWKSPM